MERRQRRERAELVRAHRWASRGVEQEAEQTYQAAMQQPIQIGTEDQEALPMEGMRQEQGLSPTDRAGTSVLSGFGTGLTSDRIEGLCAGRP